MSMDNVLVLGQTAAILAVLVFLLIRQRSKPSHIPPNPAPPELIPADTELRDDPYELAVKLSALEIAMKTVEGRQAAHQESVERRLAAFNTRLSKLRAEMHQVSEEEEEADEETMRTRAAVALLTGQGLPGAAAAPAAPAAPAAAPNGGNPQIVPMHPSTYSAALRSRG